MVQGGETAEDDEGGMNGWTSAENKVIFIAPGASLGPLICYMTAAEKGMHARDVADHERLRDLGYSRDAEGSTTDCGSNHSDERSESDEHASNRSTRQAPSSLELEERRRRSLPHRSSARRI